MMFSKCDECGRLHNGFLKLSGKEYCGVCGLKQLKATSIDYNGIIKRDKLVIGKIVEGKIHLNK